MVTTTTQDRSEGMAKLNTTLQVIRDKIEEKDGLFNVKMEVNISVLIVSNFYLDLVLYWKFCLFSLRW